MNSFFSPHSVAVIGASIKKNKIGGILVKNLVNLKFKGKIFPVNPKYKKIGPLKCYATLAQIKSTIDLVIIAVPAPLVPDLILECATHYPPLKNIIIISAGFAESGEAGARLEAKISAHAKKYSLKIIGPNCLGIINVNEKFNGSFAPNIFLPGNVSLIMQSGALTTALLDLARDENLGFSKIATIGNKTVLDENDFLDYFAADKYTKIIGMYLENIKHGAAFCRSLNRAAQNKPVIIIKSGASADAKLAIASHTGALAGDEAVTETAITDNGGLFTADLSSFLATAKLLSRFRQPRNNKIVILTNAGGPGVMTTDLIGKNKILELYEFTAAEKNHLKKFLPPESSAGNPLDILGDATSLRFQSAINLLKNNKKIGAVLVLITLQAQTDIKNIIKLLISANQKTNLPFIPVIISHETNDLIDTEFNRARLASFLYPAEAVTALTNYCSYLIRKTNRWRPSPMAKTKLSSAAASLLNILKKENRSALYYQECFELTKKYGLPVLPAVNYKKINLSKIKFPAVLKIDDPKIIHKNKKNALILDINNQSELKRAAKKLIVKFTKSNLIVQQQVTPGVEMILGLKHDSAFGPVILFGMGGITTELINQKILWLLPQNKDDIKRKLIASPIASILVKQKIKLSSIISEIRKLAVLAEKNPWLAELDFNPIIFYPHAKPIIVDVKIIAKINRLRLKNP